MLPSLRRTLALAVTAAALAPTGASAAVTKTTITTPASPAYRLYEPNVKAAPTLAVAGTSDGEPGDVVELRCDGERIDRVEVTKYGEIRADVPLKAFPRALCTLRALPEKYDGKGFDAFTGPGVAVAFFDPIASVTAVRGGATAVPLDYGLQTGQRQGYAELHSAAGGALARDVWSLGAALRAQGKGAPSPIEVDGREAFASANIPRSGERDEAPAGFEGVRATVAHDERTGDMVVRESQAIVRCEDAACLAVRGTGVRLDRTVTFTREHALIDVQDQWVTTDGQPHRLRLLYTHGTGNAESPLWRRSGETAFAPREALDDAGAGALLLFDGRVYGALRSDPAPVQSAFFDPRTVNALHHVTAPVGMRHAFEVGEQVIAEPPPPVIVPAPDNPPTSEPGVAQPQPRHRKPCRVPTVKRGAKLTSVKAALTRAGCKPPRKAKRQRSKKTRKGRVIALTRTAGTVLPEGTAIGIRISSGR